jgi:hypothetical protein
VRSEQVKNALLERIPQLSWAGVNTYGCVAVISVAEKTSVDLEQQRSGVSNIVAARDGVIHSCVVRKGNLTCKAGEVVKKGQMLISGYTDCGLIIQATQAEGEIMASTFRDFKAITPHPVLTRGIECRSVVRCGLFVGKKLINFYKDSGIYGSTCVKIYEQKNVTLPGGFQLPIGIVIETTRIYAVENDSVQNENTCNWLPRAARTYLCSSMVAGEILEEKGTFNIHEGFCEWIGKYSCLEMIGQVKNEEILIKHAKDG